LNLNPDWDAEKCFPSENREGDQGIFYFPISDVTPRDIVQCSVSVADGRFTCIGFGLGSMISSWIENVKCEDPETGDWRDCDRIDFSATANKEGKYDKLKVKANIFSSGDMICLKSYVQTTAGKVFPEKDAFWWKVIGIGQPRTVPMEIELIDKIDESKFGGTVQGVPYPAGSIALEVQQPSQKVSAFVIEFGTKQDADKEKRISTDISLIKSYRMKEKGAVNFKGWETYPVTGVLQDPINQNFKFKVTQVNFNFSKEKVGEYYKTPEITITPIASSTYSDQMWKIKLELYKPNTYGECRGSGVTKITAAPGLGFKTDEQIQIKVKKQRFTSPEQMTFNEATSAYNSKDYEEAAEKFKGVFDMNRKDKQEVLAVYWYVVSTIRRDESNVYKFNTDIDGNIKIFQAKVTGNEYDASVMGSPEFKMVNAYLGEIKTKLAAK
jgi:hypothetical protein